MKKKIKAEPADTAMAAEHQRIDRWIWHARLVRTRSLAASLINSGHVRVNGKRIVSSGHAVRREDVLTVALPGSVRVLRVTGFSERRGNAGLAVALYEDMR